MEKEMLLSLVNRIIKVDRGGPESRVGRLLAVGKDYLTLHTKEDGIIYYNRHHVKSLTHNAKKSVDLEVETEELDFIQARDFQDILECLRYKWVKVNRGGPESLEGVLEGVNNEFVTIISNEEVIRVSLFHMRNISQISTCGKSKDDKKEKSKEKDKDEHSKDKKNSSDKGNKESKEKKENNEDKANTVNEQSHNDKANKEDKSNKEDKEKHEDKANKEDKEKHEGKANKEDKEKHEGK
ncbi:hypothetical protein H9650_08160, partial [Psychrobacillus sp. Sa2BUA9]